MLSSKDLTPAIASTIKGMIKRGDRQFDIATWFNMPLTHVSNIATRKRFKDAIAAPPEFLPPPGPYQTVSVDAHARLQEAAAVPLKTMEAIVERLARLQTTLNQLVEKANESAPYPSTQRTAYATQEH